MVGMVVCAQHDISVINIFRFHRCLLNTNMLVGFAFGYCLSIAAEIWVDIYNLPARLEYKSLLPYPPDFEAAGLDLSFIDFAD